MAEKLTIVAKITAVPGSEDSVRAELEKLVAPTRAEAGCLQYDLHRDLENPRVFLFYENWETKPHWEAHMKTPHLAAFGAATQDLLEERVILQMEHIA